MSEDQELEIGSGDKKLKIRGSDIITSVVGMIVSAGLALNLYIIWQHKTEAVEAIDVARKNSEALRELNCLIMSPPGPDRDKMAAFCKKQSELQ